tara:strand:- start:592 stop:726 length:135 start_codon:yes stop_codon:yes gene_type:complete
MKTAECIEEDWGLRHGSGSGIEHDWGLFSDCNFASINLDEAPGV